jgi:mannose-6-phosphate isomerase-like protein (cupin superfamily)
MKHQEIHLEKNRDFLDGDLKKIAKQNDSFRQVIYTGPHCQLVVMSIRPGEDIGEKIHMNTDQILVTVDGTGEATLNGQVQPVEENTVIFVTAATRHNVRNTGRRALKLVMVYAPPEYADGTLQSTKDEAMHRLIPPHYQR